jgi:hypothetical protein
MSFESVSKLTLIGDGECVLDRVESLLVAAVTGRCEGGAQRGRRGHSQLDRRGCNPAGLGPGVLGLRDLYHQEQFFLLYT